MIERLRSLAGAPAVREAGAADAVHGVLPRVVVEPEDSAGCAALLAACSDEGWSVEIAGGRTARDCGRPVDRVDVMLSTRRLSGIREYEPDDLTIGVAAGTGVSELRAHVARHRQRVPLDPPIERATVGGVLARAAAGPMRRAWSTPRRQVLGIELVTGDGRVLRVGGRVVKNVAGYDLNKLIIGSAGTLGVITAAHLRLLPMPQAAATLVLRADSPDRLAGVARELLVLPAWPAALELVGAPWRLIVRYEGGADAVAAATTAATAAAASAGARVEREERALEEVSALEADAALVLRVSGRPDRLLEALAYARVLADGGGAFAAHAGDGIVRALLDGGAARGIDPIALAARVTEARRQGMTVLVERAPARIMGALDPWGDLPEPVVQLTRELRRRFDPAGILQRGRWLA